MQALDTAHCSRIPQVTGLWFSLAEDVSEETVCPLPGVGVQVAVQVFLGHGLHGHGQNTTRHEPNQPDPSRCKHETAL